jgi:hypothetical protein
MGEEHLPILVAGYQDLESARLTLMPGCRPRPRWLVGQQQMSAHETE